MRAEAPLPPEAPLVPHLGAHTSEITMADTQLPEELPSLQWARSMTQG